MLRPRGLTLSEFYARHQALSPQIVMMLDNLMKDFNLGVEVLLAGVDATGGHIYTVVNPGGTERLHDTIGYAAVGSGGIHALQAMIAFGHSASAAYHESVYRAYAAKRRAEVAPGVGRDTDMAVISSANGIHQLAADELQQLKSIYEDFEKVSSEELNSRLTGFTMGGERPTEDNDGGHGDGNVEQQSS